MKAPHAPPPVSDAIMAAMRGEKELVFRPSAMGLRVSGLFILTAAAATVYVVVQFAGGVDPMTGGKTPRDVGAFVGLIAFLSTFIASGAAAVAYYWAVRVVVGAKRLRLFNMLNRCVLNAAWEEIQVYGRVPLRDRRATSAEWQIRAAGRNATLPPLEHLAQFHLAVLDRLPAGVAVGMPRADIVRRDVWEHVASTLRNSKDEFRAGCSWFWYAGLALFATTTAFDPATRQWGALTYLLAACGLVVLAGLPCGVYAGSWRHRLRGRIEADRMGLSYNDGRSEVKIEWSDVRLVEARTIDADNEGTRDQLIVVGREAAVEVDDCFPQFHDVAKMAFTFCPDSAVMYGKAL